MAANLALSKNDAMRNEKVTSDRQKEKKYRKSSRGSEEDRKVREVTTVVLSAIHRKRTKDVINQDVWCAHSRRPIIFITYSPSAHTYRQARSENSSKSCHAPA